MPPIDSYHGLTNDEDFQRVFAARTVHIISAPYYKANPVSGEKAAATKRTKQKEAKDEFVAMEVLALQQLVNSAQRDEQRRQKRLRACRSKKERRRLKQQFRRQRMEQTAQIEEKLARND